MKETNRLVFGLDIGTRSIVGTVGYKKGKNFVVLAQCNKEHETRAMIDGQIHDIGKVADTIREVKSRLEATIEGKLTRACIAAAGRVLQTIQVHSTLDLEEEKVVTQEDIYLLHSMAIEEAYKQFVGENKSELKFYCVGSSPVRYYLNDFAMGNLENHKAKQISVDLIATFLPDDVVNGLYKAVELAGLEVANLTLEPIAAIELAIPEKFRLLNIALVDVGAGTSDISVTKDGTIVAFGMIPIAGDRLTEHIANHCMVDFATAEYIKRSAVNQDTITYDDIMGITMSISKKELLKELDGDMEEMARLACEKIKELNGGRSVGAVFVVGGGGMIPGYTDKLAEKLGLVPERVALRGKEVMNEIIFENTELNVDALLVTPIGICLNFYRETNNFIFVTFNGQQVKLYNNNNLAVVDAALQTDFPSNGFFPKSGKELKFTVNGVGKMARGTMGEPAVILLNSSPANLNTPIKENDIIEVTESTAGAEATMLIGDLAEYKAILKVNVNDKLVELPKFASVNGELKSEFYEIQQGDDIVILDYYTVSQIRDFMDITLSKDSVPMVNNRPATGDTKVYENFSVTWVITDGSELFETKAVDTQEQPVVQQVQEQPVVQQVQEQPVVQQVQEQPVVQQIQEQSAVQPVVQQIQEQPVVQQVQEQIQEQPVVQPVIGQGQILGAAPAQVAMNLQGAAQYVGGIPMQPQLQPAGQVVLPQPDLMPQRTTEPIYDMPQSYEDLEEDPDYVSSAKKKMIEELSKKTTELHVIVNGEQVSLTGKEAYVFVDIFDYIDFDLSKSKGIVITTLNGKNAEYLEPLYEGAVLEVYWKQ